MQSKVIIFGIVVVLAFAAWQSWSNRAEPVEDVRALLTAGARLIDVRTPGEFASGHLPGAINVPLSQVDNKLSEVGAPADAVVLYCLSGNRSARAARRLRELGYTNVHNAGSMSRARPALP